MAVEIKPCTVKRSRSVESLSLIHRLEHSSGNIHDAVVIDGEDVVITASDDKLVVVWQLSETGQYRPMVRQYVPSSPTCLCYVPLPCRLVVGQDNGTISEFELYACYSKIALIRDYLAHSAGVVACHFCPVGRLLLSLCCFDQTLLWHRVDDGTQMALYTSFDEPHCLTYDVLSRHTFVGDSAGAIAMLHMKNGGFALVTKLIGHTSAVRSLLWEHKRKWLFSGSSDHTVIMWNIGGGNGIMYQLHVHTASVVTLCFCSLSGHLISGSNDGLLAIWDMNAEREQPVSWSESDTCQLCEKPFFWNLRAMFNSKQLAINRQHHCRKCGRAVCDTCASHKCTLPTLGHELPARVCRLCYDQLLPTPTLPTTTSSAPSPSPDQLPAQRSLCRLQNSQQQPLVACSFDSSRGLLLTASNRHTVKLWEMDWATTTTTTTTTAAAAAAAAAATKQEVTH